MSQSLVTIRSYASELEAEIGRATLEANGIEALVHRADAAGLLRAVEPAELLVYAEDLERARAVLDGAPLTADDNALWDDEGDDADDDLPPMVH